MRNKKVVFNKEIFCFYSLFFFTAMVVYFTPKIVCQMYLLSLLAIFWQSKKDYFWFAFVFLIIQEPGFLFHGELSRFIKGIPYFSLTSGLSFTFPQLFFILSFFKGLTRGKHLKLILRKPLLLLLIYFIFLWLIGFIHGINQGNFNYFVKLSFVFLLFISFPYLVNKKDEVYRFIHLIFPIIYFIFFTQVFEIYTGIRFGFWLGGTGESQLFKIAQTTGNFDIIRPTTSSMLIFFSFGFGMFLIVQKNYKGNRVYLYSIISIAYLSAFISATRAWIIMFSVILFLYFLFVRRDIRKILPQMGVLLVIGFVLTQFSPRIETSLEYSVERLSTVEFIMQGDVTAGGTLHRVDLRLPKVLEGFKKNPITGWGNSNTYRLYEDGHVGNFNLLLHVGIIGFLFFCNLWYKFLMIIIKTRKKLMPLNSLRQSLLVLILIFLGMLILHFTSLQFFGFFMEQAVNFFIIIFFIISEFFIRQAIREEL